MSNDVETADDGRSVLFPPSWGTPPAGLEERTRWINQHICDGDARLDRGERLTWKRAHTPKQILAALSKKRESPAFGNAARMRLLKLLERGPV